MICPLCSASAELFFSDSKVAHADFNHCPQCDLIFKSPEFLPDTHAERARYALHKNSAEDGGYVRFLQPAVEAVTTRISAKFSANSSGRSAEKIAGLDYGCGPGPVLSELLRAQGYAMTIYDPYFADDRAALEVQYDFITCTEVAEHFYEPKKDFAKLFSLLKPDGFLVVMTGLHRGREAFRSWHYRIDPTHVSFYSAATFKWIAGHFRARGEHAPGSTVVVLTDCPRKSNRPD